ncbi:protein neprosin-like [Corylus avellana]|uniref:protein neprosin-like n=1 Tax=Corylus avellana TaxID=13451 RepID=UPI001E215CA7|nr:protein neprosin-like [Corylus avellana]
MALFMLVILGVIVSFYGVDAGRSMLDDQLVNAIQPRDVGGFDCVDIYKQPAFDHPLLKNHKIQMNPSFSTRSKTNEVFSKSQFVDMGCPPGMVPIQRTRVHEGQTHDFKNSFSESQGGSFHTYASNIPGEYSVSVNTTDAATYHGARALIVVNNPQVKVSGQYSKAQIWVQNGPNTIEAGWAVHPGTYFDNDTHLTTFWTVDGYKHGCYNARCPGYIQVHRQYFPGDALTEISVYDGQQFAVNLTIAQDKSTGNWWLKVGNDSLGYWPKEIFTHLATGASSIRYGGVTFSPPNIRTPVPMGNGFLPVDFAPLKAGLFIRVQMMKADNPFIDINSEMIHNFHDIGGQCYGLVDVSDIVNMGKSFNFGGPGGSCMLRT